MSDLNVNPNLNNLSSDKVAKDETIIKGNRIKIGFPIGVFPNEIQSIISETNESLNYPVDFMSGAILYAAAIAVGNSFQIEAMKGYKQNAIHYLAIVGRAGTNKSHPLSFALKPIERKDARNYRSYSKAMDSYTEKKEMSKKELAEKNLTIPTEEPFWKQYIVSDFTPEALIKTHENNLRGLGVYVDELAGWFNNFNRYSSGSEEQFWLSNWSGKPIRVNRISKDPIFIEKPCISVGGTIQPSILEKVLSDKTNNGFLDRILFIVSPDTEKKYWSDKELNPSVVKSWQSIMDRLISIDTGENETLRLSSEANKQLREWQRVLTDKSNKEQREEVKSTLSKLEQYCLRFALILEMLHFGCIDETMHSNELVSPVEITLKSVLGAIQMVSYFEETAKQVQSIILDSNPVDKLTTDKRHLYDDLPGAFKTDEGLLIASKHKIEERSFKRFLNNKDLFTKVRYAFYEKKL